MRFLILTCLLCCMSSLGLMAQESIYRGDDIGTSRKADKDAIKAIRKEREAKKQAAERQRLETAQADASKRSEGDGRQSPKELQIIETYERKLNDAPDR